MLSFLALSGCLAFACSCAPLSPNQIKLRDQWRMYTGIEGYYNFDEATPGTAPGGNDFADSSGLGPPAKSNGNLTLGAHGVKNLGSPLHAFLVWMHSPNGFFTRTTPTLSPGWHNVITTYDRIQSSQNSITLYLDVTLISTNTFSGQNNSAATPFANSTLYLLCRAGTTLCLQADLDELII